MAKRNYAKRETSEYTFITKIYQWIALWICTAPYIFLFYRVKFIGRENIPKNKSFLVASTHGSYLDPELVSIATKRPIAYMGKKELFEVPIFGDILAALGAFAVDRNNLSLSTIKTSQAIMKTNHWILAMFPQGTRDIPNKITKITPGFAYLARAAKAPILPISITGTEKMSKIPFSRQIILKIGEPFEVSKDLADTMTHWCEAVEKLGDYEFTQQAKDKIERIRQHKAKETAEQQND